MLPDRNGCVVAWRVKARGWRAALLGCLALAACQASRTAVEHDADAPADLAVDPPSPPDLGPIPCDDRAPCAEGSRCYRGFCIPDNGLCGSDHDCQNDTYCACPLAPGVDGGGDPDGGDPDGGDPDGGDPDGGDPGDGGARGDGGAGGGDGGRGACLCVPWGSQPRGPWDPSCRRPPYSLAEVVTPTLLCQYTGDGVESTPLVADLDGDGRPEVLFQTTTGGLHAMHGADCSPYFDVRFDFAEYNASQLAVADLDLDGKPEIIGVDRSRRVAVFDNHGSLIASSPLPYDFVASGVEELGGPAVVDLDGVAPPEIVIAGQVLRWQSHPEPALIEAWANNDDMLPSYTHLPFWGALTTAADLDGDGVPEVIAGAQVFRASDGADLTPAQLVGLGVPRGGFAGVADFNGDGAPDLALVLPVSERRRQVAIYDWKNSAFLLDPVDTRDGWGGAPAIADFDGDGEPEVAVAGNGWMVLYSPRCAPVGMGRPATCDPQGLSGEVWSRRISDQSSGSSGASAFDFNGDGASEVVYRDECWLRALDGRTGKALWAVPASSATGLELPPVADLDGDGHAEIIVSSTAYPQCKPKDDLETGARWTGLTNGVMIYSDPAGKWMPARPLWNEHAYHVTNVLDDLTVPRREVPSWTRWNGYRQNEQGIDGRPYGIGDFTGRAPSVQSNQPIDCAAAWTLSADLCNRGAGTIQRGVPGAFYRSDPRVGSPTPVCTTVTTKSLSPGACQTVSCDWKMPPVLESDLWFRAADDGQGGRPEQCRDDNDLLVIPGAHCNING